MLCWVIRNNSKLSDIFPAVFYLSGTSRKLSANSGCYDLVASSESVTNWIVMSVKPLDLNVAKNSIVLSKGKTSYLYSKPLKASKIGNTAIVYCEKNFGAVDGKTANGLVRSSDKYKILSVIDSEKSGMNTGALLDNKVNDIPICLDLDDALASAFEQIGCVPDFFIFGMAPSSGMLSLHERSILLEAMAHGMNIVNGLHEFLNDDPIFMAACTANNVMILDVRKPPSKKDLRLYSGRIAEVSCPRIAVLGTDCAIGKRTTATVLCRELNARGIKAVMIGTGQTGLIQGARYGVALDAIPSQFCVGELEATIVEAFENENPDVIIIEGQSSLSHPAFSSSSFILRGSRANGVILQHAPKREYRCDFEGMQTPTPESEIHLIETFADTKVIGLTINHEGMSDSEVSAAIASYQKELGISVTDALSRSPEHLVSMVVAAFPEISANLLTAA